MISVCMASYNGERFIMKQINSILTQMQFNDELIISDDGSTDGTIELIKSIKDPRIKLLNHQKTNDFSDDYFRNHKLATHNFENAIKNAQGDYIFLTDQDDVWVEEKLNHILLLLKEYDLVLHNYSIIDEKDNLVKDIAFSRNPIHKSIFMNVLDNHFRGCCMAFKKNALNYILPIPNNVVGHDYWIGVLISHFGKVFYEMKPLLLSRWYSESVTGQTRSNKKHLFYSISHRFFLLIEVLKRIFCQNKK